MKLYDFHCNQCSRDFEDLVRAPSDARCRVCGSSDVVRTLSVFAVGGVHAEPAAAPPSCGTSCSAGFCGLD